MDRNRVEVAWVALPTLFDQDQSQRSRLPGNFTNNYADKLKAAIKATLASITPKQIHRLIPSMLRYNDAVIHANWAQTKYGVHIVQ